MLSYLAMRGLRLGELKAQVGSESILHNQGSIQDRWRARELFWTPPRRRGKVAAGGVSMTLKVIGAGFGRTGTMSLKLALEQLGFGPCYHMIEVFKHQAWDL